MAKFKTTTKSIREGYDRKHIIVFGYYEAQNLLQALEPTDYTRGIYGWNYDVYRIYDVCICTGYRGMPAGIAPDYDITKEYEKKAATIWSDYSKSSHEKRNEVLELLLELIDKTQSESK